MFDKLHPMYKEAYRNYPRTEYRNELLMDEEVSALFAYVSQIKNLTNEMVDYLNDFAEKFDAKLYNTVDAILKKWFEDGLISNIVEEYLNEKISLGFDVYNTPQFWGAIGDGEVHLLSEKFETLEQAKNYYGDFVESLNDTIDFCALQKSMNYCYDNKKPCLTLDGKYRINRTLKPQTVSKQQPISIIGNIGKGSYFRIDQTTQILPTANFVGDYLLVGIGHGLRIENIVFNGEQKSVGGLRIERGFELVLRNVRTVNFTGTGLELLNLSNASVTDVHVDDCGDDGDTVGAYKPACRIGGATISGVNEKVTNSSHFSSLHIERSKSTALQLGLGEAVSKAEFCTFTHLHIEQALDNTGRVYAHQRNVLDIGAVRGVSFDGGFIYGQGNRLVNIRTSTPLGTDNDSTQVNFYGTEIKGYTTSGSTTDLTANTLMRIQNARYVGLYGVIFAHVRTGGTHLEITNVAEDVNYSTIFINDNIGAKSKIIDSRVIRYQGNVKKIDDVVTPVGANTLYLETNKNRLFYKDDNYVNKDVVNYQQLDTYATGMNIPVLDDAVDKARNNTLYIQSTTGKLVFKDADAVNHILF